MIELNAKHIGGLDEKIGRKIKKIIWESNQLRFADYSDDIAKLQLSSVRSMEFYTEKASGLLKRNTETHRVKISYETKSGNLKTIVFETADPHLFISFWNGECEKRQRAEYINGRMECSENIHVRGESFFSDSFKQLRIEDPDYSLSKTEILENGQEEDNIYKYYFSPKIVEIRPEPKNQYDPNAMAVYVDDLQVGYIPKGSTAHIRKIEKECEIEKISAFIGGGPYKTLVQDDENEDSYKWEKDELPYSVTLRIKYLKEQENGQS